MDLPEGPTIHLVTFRDGSSFSSESAFDIHKWLQREIGDVDHAKPLRSGALLVKVLDREQALALSEVRAFQDRPVTSQLADRLNSIEALAYAPSLLRVSEDDILAQLAEQGVIGVRRLRPRDGKPSPLLRLKFRGRAHPVSVRAGYEILPLRLWIRAPVMCRRCASYGHGDRTCRAPTARCLRCSGQHCTDECRTGRRRCPHCGGPHAAWERDCEILQDQLHRTEEEQRANTEPPTPPPTAPTLAEALARPSRDRPRRPAKVTSGEVYTVREEPTPAAEEDGRTEAQPAGPTRAEVRHAGTQTEETGHQEAATQVSTTTCSTSSQTYRSTVRSRRSQTEPIPVLDIPALPVSELTTELIPQQDASPASTTSAASALTEDTWWDSGARQRPSTRSQTRTKPAVCTDPACTIKWCTAGHTPQRAFWE